MEPGNPHETTDTPPHPRWCFGLPLAGVAPLEASEREAVRRHARSLIVRVLRFVALMLVVPGLLTLVGFFVPGTAETLQIACGVAALLVFFLGAVATVLSTLGGLREARQLRSDLRGGEVLVFRGEAPSLPTDEEVSQPAILVELRVLPASRMWLRAEEGGVALRGVRIQHAAPPPAYAWRVALHDDLVPRGAARDLRFEQRRLTPSEGREIVAYARRLVVPGLGEIAYALCAALIFTSLILSRVQDPNAVPPDEGMAALVSLAFLPVVVFLYGRRIRLARKLHVDLEAGRAVTAVPSAAGESLAPETVREFLPVSGVTWTFAGRPATWRDAPPDGPSALVRA